MKRDGRRAMRVAATCRDMFLPAFRLSRRRDHDPGSARQGRAVVLHAGPLRYAGTVPSVGVARARERLSPGEILEKKHTRTYRYRTILDARVVTTKREKIRFVNANS